MTRASLAVLAAAFLFSVSIFASGAPSGSQMEMRRVTADVFVLYGDNDLGASVGVIETAKGLVLVDTMEAAAADRLGAALRHRSSKSVSHIFNTHGHSDHAGGNDVFLQQGASLIRHPGLEGDNAGWTDGKLALSLEGVRLEAYAISSHTPDDIIVYLPEQNVIFMGDTFTTSWHPTFYAGGEEGQLAVIDKVLELADEHTVIVPGHGKAANRDGLMLYKSAFLGWMSRMRFLAMMGAGAEEMQKDAYLRETVAHFLQDGGVQELPKRAYQRFIERTVSTELMPVDKGVLTQLADYVGDYRYEDGMALRVEEAKGGLRIIEGGHLPGIAIPLSRSRFHFPGRLEGEGYLTFQFDSEGNVTGATYVGEGQSWLASRVRD